jgi:hypothetical protein
MKACGVLLLWLLSVSEGLASHAPRATAKACDPHTTSIRKLIRQARAVGGPVAKRVKKKLRSVQRRTTHVERGRRPSASDDGQAIQNDAPVAHVIARPVPELRSLGLFVDILEQQPFTLFSSPQSPRGPPASA